MRADPDVVVGEVRRRGWTKVGFGLYRREGDTDEVRADLLAWQEVLPPSGCLTHLTGGVVHGLWLPPLPVDLPVFVSMSKQENRPKRPELLVMRHTQPVRTVTRAGLSVATPDEVVLACSRDLALLDVVVMGDSALHQGITSKPIMKRSAGRRRWGSALMTRAIDWMDEHSESAWESVIRVFHRACGIPVEPQHVVRDSEGAFVARGDLWIVGTRTLHEYDGAVHRDRRTHRQDLARDRKLLTVGWQRRGYTAYDLLQRPQDVLREADAALGRPHRVDRLDPWLRILQESLFHPVGQERFRRRLARRTSGRSLEPTRR